MCFGEKVLVLVPSGQDVRLSMLDLQTSFVGDLAASCSDDNEFAWDQLGWVGTLLVQHLVSRDASAQME